MAATEDTLYALIDPLLTGMGYELVGIEYGGPAGKRLLRIYIDSPDGITLDDCETCSRQISAVLDVEDPIPGEYTLEISSPGLDRPIFKAPDFDRFAGEQIKIRLSAPWEGRRRFKGVLTGLGEEGVRIVEAQGGEVEIPLDLIEKARLILEP